MNAHPSRPMLRPALLLAALLSNAAFAQPLAVEPASARVSAAEGRVTREDQDFLRRVARISLAEVEGGRLAESRGLSEGVKTFARQLVADHTRTATEVEALAALKGIDAPDSPSLSHEGKLKWLHALEGAGFDRRYIDQFGIKAHEDTVKLFEDTVQRTRDSEIKAFAVKTLPTLKQHLDAARELKAASGS